MFLAILKYKMLSWSITFNSCIALMCTPAHEWDANSWCSMQVPAEVSKEGDIAPEPIGCLLLPYCDLVWGFMGMGMGGTLLRSKLHAGPTPCRANSMPGHTGPCHHAHFGDPSCLFRSMRPVGR